MLQQFKQRKANVLALADDVINDMMLSPESIQESGMEESVRRLEEERFRIALVAPFSAGKSTFINGLIGEDLLSMDVRAETATITTLKYNEQRRIEVEYFDGQIDTFPSQGETLSLDELKRLLKTKTTVNRTKESQELRVEETVRKVDVYWDLPLCKGGVEIVDTPGLFSRHDIHSTITKEILPTVNAVLFLIEPDSVGDANFSEVINQRVEEAKSSNLEKDGRHIFFILNKIDRFTPRELDDARSDLLEVLQPLLPQPQIYEVSSYYAMKSRMYFNKELQLLDLQLDDKIKSKNERGFSVMGESLQHEHVQCLVEISRILEIEEGLARYLENKNNYLIDEVLLDIEGIYNRAISDLSDQIELTENALNQDREGYIQRLDDLKKILQTLTRELTKNVERTIREELVGTSSGGGGLEAVVNEVQEHLIDKLIDEMLQDANSYWGERKNRLTEHNVETFMEELTNWLNHRIGISKKQLIKRTFELLKNKIGQTGNKLNTYFEYFESQVQERYQQQLDLKDENNADNVSFFNVDLLMKQLEKSLEKEFSKTLIKLSDKLKNDIKDSRDNNESYVNKPGLFNFIKSIFGRAEKERRFNDSKFRNEITDMVSQVSKDAGEEFRMEAYRIGEIVEDKLRGVVNSFQGTVKGKIDSYQAWKNRMIETMNIELHNIEKSLEQVVNENHQRIDLCRHKLQVIAAERELEPTEGVA
ncbi:dynamin family protein [Paenibacillus frigoriresistens]|uniref:dynamin family protein n=1 Tax=Paenibacillus alginolyticus TaxID=59839 RepID=UPI00156786C1|nr:dynamin family protein [Paenibacillus frigoriresistens]NRF93592.1 dynamin family protein [Paenibacillus frigoriresistens]